jgi:hypothetical protein
LSITTQHIQERLCVAHIEAIVGSAGVNLTNPRRQDYGIDGTLAPVKIVGTRRVESGFKVDFQAKSTINWQFDNDHVVYDLEAQTYNDLVGREPSVPRCVLILLCLPQGATDWLNSSETGLLLRNCCYWQFVEGEATENVSTKRIKIPRTNVLTAASVHDILQSERDRLLVSA